jgi:small-conductance mechanosensitive channel
MIPLISGVSWARANSASRELVVGLAVVVIGTLSLLAGPVLAEQAPTPPQKVQELMELLRDPAVANWLTAEANPKTEQKASEPRRSLQLQLEEKLREGRERTIALWNGFALLGPDLSASRSKIASELSDFGFTRGWQLIAAFLGLGLGSFWVAVRLTNRSWQMLSQTSVTSVRERLRLILTRTQITLVRMLAFTLGSLGLFLLFDWPPLVRTLSIGVLAAAQGVVLAALLANLILAPTPGARELRLLPLGDDDARSWFGRAVICGVLLSLAVVARGLLERLGFNADSAISAQFAFVIALAAAMLEAIWRGYRNHRLVVSSAIVALLIFWVLGADFLFWLTVLAGLVPAVIAIVETMIRHVTRPVDQVVESPVDNLLITAVRRGIRAAILLVALWALEQSLPISFTGDSDRFGRIVNGLFRGAAILIVFDFLWYLTRTLIERKIAELKLPGTGTDESQIRRQRLGTLLPILKNFLLVTFITIAGLMTLSGMGVAIGPLLAGASVIGVALGFGSQTLVKDVLSGVFYLMDDAFRVGEYIQSGNYKGTVESFTLRSVRLRHHRGPVYTVPFGSLGAIENLSRDWVLEKIVIAVAFDTDLIKVKKLIRQVGNELLAEPEFAPHIIETVKMQGVEEFGDYGIRLRLKIVTRPGEQFPIRRKAYQRIKELFDQNGVKFAVPKVQVAEGEEHVAAAVTNLRPVPSTKAT